MTQQDSEIEIALPDWLSAFAARRSIIESVEERMAFVIAAARANVQAGTGGPFAAAVFESATGRLVSLGVNLVLHANLSVLHAEIVALTLAQRALGTYDLGGTGLPRHELVSSVEPCAMCYGAVPWSGVTRLICGARSHDARRIGFDEGPQHIDWSAALGQRGIAVRHGVMRDQAAAVLEDYVRGGGRIYNARETGVDRPALPD
jgi:tRNA(Arg) A34 adenosine deaminase TadA